MESPSPALLGLYGIGVIAAIKINYRPPHPPHTPGEGTYVELQGNLGRIVGRWEDYREFLELRVGFNSVAEIKPEFDAVLERWRLFEAKEAKDLAEYARLKKKFERG